jgi:hypothetical protein
MRKSLTISTLLLGAATLLFLGQRAAHTETPSSQQPSTRGDVALDDRLIVHEWGTFTSFSGSDGVRLEFRPLVDSDLPGFVINRAKQVGAYHDGGKARWLVRERMETPVTYFYTDREREVNVKVGFPKGLLTEFYPPVKKMLPPFEQEKVVRLRDAELDWGTVRLIPEAKLRTAVAERSVSDLVHQRLLGALLPGAGPEHYGYARDTDSAIVHMRLPNDPKRDVPSGDFFEKFLFYRGIGNFSLPINVQALGGGQFEVRNSGADPIHALFLVTAENKELRFAYADSLAPGGKMTMLQSTKPATMDDLSGAVVQALVGARLYEKEARAMVNTWRNSWFGEGGTRLFYLVPGRLTDELLPLTISPQPDETVRVLVGRYEIMSPEDEARVTRVVEQSIRDRAAFQAKAEKDEKLRETGYQLPKAVKQLGRLAEPALARVKTISKDQRVKDEARALLSQLLNRYLGEAAE